jgi:allantoate deiminase/N-carbamoyl-L-amino-acid hydrolase
MRPAGEGSFGTRVMVLADQLAQWSEAADELTCTFLSPAHRAVAGQLRDWMQAAGLRAEIDAAANVVGRSAAADPNARTLIVASHYDTVRNAGRYDGRLGVLAGLVAMEELQRTGSRLPFHVELIAFSEEEGVRFGAPFIGSSAVAGRFKPEMLALADASGVSVAHALRGAGLDPGAIPSLARRDLLGYLEVHIEQGPVLLQADRPVGIVSAIAGAVRLLLVVTGQAGHAGTVPMAARHDAAAAAAEIVLAVERHCTVPTLVGTVGRLAVPDGAINVIPGRCELSIDIRAGDDATRDAALAAVLADADAIARRRGVTVEHKEIARAPAVACSARLQRLLGDAAKRCGAEPVALASGAGHDAMMFDGLTDLAMLFVRCGNGGISHSPDETVTAADADVAVRVLLDALLHFQDMP